MRWVRGYLGVSAGLVRVSLLCLLALALALVVTANAAVAAADQGMMDLGRHLMALSEAGIGSDSRGMLVNGQQVRLRVFSTEHDIETVLNFYENWCRDGIRPFAAQEDELFVVNQSPLTRVSGDRSWRDLTRRKADDDMGFVGCLKHGIPDITSEELGTRLMRFFESGNLRELGHFHYAAATRIGETTRVVAVWTDGDFFPGSMFPGEHDAPGFDTPGLSRPPSGRRMLSAGEIGHAETLTVYTDTEHSIAELGVFYRRDFLDRGWRVLRDEREGDASWFFIVQRGRRMSVVSLSKDSGQPPSVAIATTD